VVALIGTSLAVAPVAFAAAAPQGKSQPLAENCYYEVQTVTNAAGQSVTQRIVECD
jgi:hypothetical protein